MAIISTIPKFGLSNACCKIVIKVALNIFGKNRIKPFSYSIDMIFLRLKTKKDRDNAPILFIELIHSYGYKYNHIDFLFIAIPIALFFNRI